MPPPVEDEEEERPWPPPMRMKLAPYAMYRVFGGMGPAGDKLGAAYVGLHFALYAIRALSLSPVAERALFWAPVHLAVQSLCFAATALILVAFIRWYMAVDGVYVVEYEPPPQQPPRAAAIVVEQLPPPPPEMDMCAAFFAQIGIGLSLFPFSLVPWYVLPSLIRLSYDFLLLNNCTDTSAGLLLSSSRTQGAGVTVGDSYFGSRIFAITVQQRRGRRDNLASPAEDLRNHSATEAGVAEII
ncbi:hypothetical protein BAE44_0022343 [Dichanthelium oligosanthes]|uniref:Uncharacterized protein n=1 Tax=Dichanthelium oligosanthes TaxID=888268 RepID=A0A1E5UUR9_9POAL|nr:hypothetical protein BAE44_0022343 [Dichanthelium oligosanthes]